MKTKLLEIRDASTFIPVLCVNMNPYNGDVRGVSAHDAPYYEARRYLLRRCGYPCDGVPNIAISHLSADGKPMWNDPYGWGGRTYPVAHKYIIEHWDELHDGDVIDVEFILGEKPAPKKSERETARSPKPQLKTAPPRSSERSTRRRSRRLRW